MSATLPPKGSGTGTGHSGSDTSFQRSASEKKINAPDSKRTAAKSKVEAPPDQHLRSWLMFWGVVWLLLLVGLTVVGLRATDAEVSKNEAPPSASPTTATAAPSASATPTPAASPSATQTVPAAQVATPAADAVATATPTPPASPAPSATVAAAANVNAETSPSPTPKPSVSPTPTSTPNPAVMFAARQHFITLAVVTATMVLFPWVLLLAFAFQRAPRLYRDLKKDLEALGLYRGPEQMKRNLEKNLTATILPTLQATEPGIAKDYVDLLLEFAQRRNTGTGGTRPSDIEGRIWDEAYRKADDAREGNYDLGTLEREMPDMIKVGLQLARENLATRYARQLVERAIAATERPVDESSDPGPPPGRISDDLWNQSFAVAMEEAKPILQEFKVAEEKIGIKQRFGVPEFLLPLMSMTPIVLVTFVWALWPKSVIGFASQMALTASLNDYFGGVVAKMAPAAVAVVTGYLFMMLGLMRRYHRSDITPGGYWEVLSRLIVVFLLALVGSVFLFVDPGGAAGGNVLVRSAAAVAPTTAIALGILAGVFPVDTLRFIVKAVLSRIRKSLAGNDAVGQDLERRFEKTHPLSLLDDLDPWDELRLTEEGVIGIQGMATADIAHLLIWTPFTTHQIVDWVDQSILFLGAGAEPDAQYVRTFRKMGLRGVSDLIDATRTPADRKRVVAAARAVQKTPVKNPADANEDPLIAAQRAAADVQPKVKSALELVSQVKDKKKDDPLDATTRASITSAVSGIRDALESINSAVTRVKSGGERLAAALEAANSLQTKFKSAGDKADEVEQALSAATEKVTEDLEAKLKALGEELTVDPDANSQAQELLDTLNEIAKPLAQTETRAREFAEKAGAIQKKAETTQTDLPGEVGEAENLFKSLTSQAQEAQSRINANPAFAEAAGYMDDLVKRLTDDSADGPKLLIGELKKQEEWIATGEGSQARSYANAQKLVGQTAEILKQVQAAGQSLETQQPPATGVIDSLPLTDDVLVTMLNGLERNPNLRRILRYLTSEVAAVPAPVAYTSNNDWLGVPRQ